MDEDGLSTLKRLLAERLKNVQLTARETTEGDYDKILARVIRRVPAMHETVTRNQARVEERYSDLVDRPGGQQRLLVLDILVAHGNEEPFCVWQLAEGSIGDRFDQL